MNNAGVLNNIYNLFYSIMNFDFDFTGNIFSLLQNDPRRLSSLRVIFCAIVDVIFFGKFFKIKQNNINQIVSTPD